MTRRSSMVGAAVIVLAAIAAPVASADFSFTKTDYAVTTAPVDIDIGDLDGINGPDIVYTTIATGSNPDGRVVRLLNQGGGSFGAPQTTVSCNFGYEVILHNFTPASDSNLDALVTCGTLRGDGAGGFITPSIPTGAPIQEAMTLAELTGSGVPELVYGGPGNNTNVLCFSTWSSPSFGSFTCGNPNPPFTNQPRQFPRFSFAATTTVALDNTPPGDPPRDDIITASLESAEKINIYGRDPNPGVDYNAWSDTTRTTSAGAITGIASGDVNGDGTIDVLVSHGIDTDPRFDLFIWDPGTGLAATPLQTPTIMRPEEIFVRDFNGDGKQDVVLANGIGELAVHAGIGDGTFAAPEIFALTGGNGNVDFVVGDVSGDAKPDIVVVEARVGSGNLAVLINGSTPPPPGPGPPTPPPVTPTPPTPPPSPVIPDTAAPETKITKGPPAETKKLKAKFKFTSDEPGSSFECKLDKAAYQACASPRSYTVDQGKHKFAVRATDLAGNVDATPAKQKFKVE